MNWEVWIGIGVGGVFNAGVLWATVFVVRKAVERLTDRFEKLQREVAGMAAADPLMVARISHAEGQLGVMERRAYETSRVWDERHIDLVREIERLKASQGGM